MVPTILQYMSAAPEYAVKADNTSHAAVVIFLPFIHCDIYNAA